MILPFGKPPPKAMSSVKAPLGMISLHKQLQCLSWADSRVIEAHVSQDITFFRDYNRPITKGRCDTLQWLQVLTLWSARHSSS